MALGAQQEGIVGVVVRRGLLLTLIRLIIGVEAALGLTRFLESQLHSVTPTDPETVAVLTVVLILVGLLASYIAARRAPKVDPLVALRHE